VRPGGVPLLEPPQLRDYARLRSTSCLSCVGFDASSLGAAAERTGGGRLCRSRPRVENLRPAGPAQVGHQVGDEAPVGTRAGPVVLAGHRAEHRGLKRTGPLTIHCGSSRDMILPAALTCVRWTSRRRGGRTARSRAPFGSGRTRPSALARRAPPTSSLPAQAAFHGTSAPWSGPSSWPTRRRRHAAPFRLPVTRMRRLCHPHEASTWNRSRDPRPSMEVAGSHPSSWWGQTTYRLFPASIASAEPVVSTCLGSWSSSIPGASSGHTGIAMYEAPNGSGLIGPGGTIVEPTSATPASVWPSSRRAAATFALRLRDKMSQEKIRPFGARRRRVSCARHGCALPNHLGCVLLGRRPACRRRYRAPTSPASNHNPE